MQFKKIFSDVLDHCYAVMRLKDGKGDFLIVASEEDSACIAYDLNNNLKKTVVWPDVGGTMTLVQIPNSLNFLATQRFYPGFNSKDCQIVKETFDDGKWKQKIIGDFPYIHRFDIIKKRDEAGFWFIGCSIANSKINSEDWSDPGKIWVGEYDDNQERIRNLHALKIRITKNHGYKRMCGYSLVTGVEGIFKLDYPTRENDWRITKLSSNETSDIFSADVNGDGKKEYLTIEGFHGPYLRLSDEKFHSLVQTKAKTPFGHAIWGGKIGNQECFIFGWRDGKRNLVLISDDKIDMQVIDEAVGPSNVLVYNKNGVDYLLSANREINEVAIYKIDFRN